MFICFGLPVAVTLISKSSNEQLGIDIKTARCDRILIDVIFYIIVIPFLSVTITYLACIIFLNSEAQADLGWVLHDIQTDTFFLVFFGLLFFMTYMPVLLLLVSYRQGLLFTMGVLITLEVLRVVADPASNFTHK